MPGQTRRLKECVFTQYSCYLRVQFPFHDEQRSCRRSINKLSSGLRINAPPMMRRGLHQRKDARPSPRPGHGGAELPGRHLHDPDGGRCPQRDAFHSAALRELSVQAANDTLTSQDRGYIQLEIEAAQGRNHPHLQHTQFNKKKLLDGPPRCYGPPTSWRPGRSSAVRCARSTSSARRSP